MNEQRERPEAAPSAHVRRESPPGLVPGLVPGRKPRVPPSPSPVPVPVSGVDQDFEEWAAWVDREILAGRDPLPPERTPAQGISVSLGDGDGIAPDLLAAVCGTDCGGGPGPQFAQDAAADVLPPSPALTALTEAAVADVTRLTDNQLIGVLQAARRQENREAWKKALVIAEFARRRAAELDAAAARGAPVHCRPGQFPGEELAMELLLGPIQASRAIDDATDLATRLPVTLAGMAAGLIDEARAGVIAFYTRGLSPQDAALADEILAVLAPDLRLDQLARKADALEKKLDPEAAKARREHARRTRQRVEVRPEESGNASVAGREMDTADALAAKAHIHSLALRLRRSGLPGTLDQLRLLVFSDLTTGRDPLDRFASQDAHRDAERGTGRTPAPTSSRDPDAPTTSAGGPGVAAPGPGASGVAAPGPGASGVAAPGPGAGDAAGSAGAQTSPADDNAPGGGATPDDAPASGDDRASSDVWAPDDVPPPEAPTDAGTETEAGRSGGAALDYDHDEWDDGSDTTRPAAYVRPSAPQPAMINLVVHAGTLFGWDTTPSEAGGWGLLDAEETRAIVAAASRHPATRWCFTLLGRDGTAAAHGCSPGQHPWTPRRQNNCSPGQRAPTPAQAAQFAAFLQSLNLALAPIARGDCDHASAEPRYVPSRKLAHLVRARTATCDAPGCAAQALYADLDHTVPYPDGPTDQCNLGPKCRRHHKAKQAPGWKVEQSEPGVIRWTLPSGRTHTTRPTVYDPSVPVRIRG